MATERGVASATLELDDFEKAVFAFSKKNDHNDPNFEKSSTTWDKRDWQRSWHELRRPVTSGELWNEKARTDVYVLPMLDTPVPEKWRDERDRWAGDDWANRTVPDMLGGVFRPMPEWDAPWGPTTTATAGSPRHGSGLNPPYLYRMREERKLQAQADTMNRATNLSTGKVSKSVGRTDSFLEVGSHKRYFDSNDPLVLDMLKKRSLRKQPTLRIEAPPAGVLQKEEFEGFGKEKVKKKPYWWLT